MLKKNNFFIHEKIQPKKIYYGFFTRLGGISKKNLKLLNLTDCYGFAGISYFLNKKKAPKKGPF